MLDIKAPVFPSPFLPLTGHQQTFLFVLCSIRAGAAGQSPFFYLLRTATRPHFEPNLSDFSSGLWKSVPNTGQSASYPYQHDSGVGGLTLTQGDHTISCVNKRRSEAKRSAPQKDGGEIARFFFAVPSTDDVPLVPGMKRNRTEAHF
ncbi:hypothetical protein EDB82DRAFT_516389 [Fusarium venenatum]|uniref:uncharacterized protein n=1 Tax=Fusarium venenatum TaxID=56646 RepID=UPI001D393C85|nr:hypothetical protein EDB82DRAFT_516389 [Fusarium venenatum]